MTYNYKIAVLIDAENVSSKIIEPLFKEISKLGNANVKRIYGDWTSNQLAQWKPILLPHAIEPKQQFSYTRGKNASDIAMVIDAMDLLHSHHFDAVCLVSSDSDFTPLVIRMQQEGINVFGFGQKKSPEPFVNACHRFIYLEDIETNTVNAPAVATKKIDSSSRRLLKEAILEYEDAEGWADVGQIGLFLRKNINGFQVADYGFKNLSNWIRACGGQFELRFENSIAMARLRANKNKASTPVANTQKIEPWHQERLNEDVDLRKRLRQAIHPLQNLQGWANLIEVEKTLQTQDWQQYGYSNLSALIDNLHYVQKQQDCLSVAMTAKQTQQYLDSFMATLADEDGWVSSILLAERLAQVPLFNASILGYPDALTLILGLKREDYAFMTLYGQKMIKPKSSPLF